MTDYILSLEFVTCVYTFLFLRNRPREILFQILDGPALGQIYREDVPVSEFSARDLEDGKIEYRNNVSTRIDHRTTKDNARFLVEIPDADPGRTSGFLAKAEGVITFHVFPESYWDPLEIASNNSLLVEESTSIALTQYDLQVKILMPWMSQLPDQPQKREKEDILYSGKAIKYDFRKKKKKKHVVFFT